MGIIGKLLGLMNLLRDIGRWNVIGRFSRQIQSPAPFFVFLVKHYMQQGKNKIWTKLYYEASSQYDKYLTLENLPPLNAAIGRGKGVILMGVHCGPALSSVLFMRFNTDIMHVIGQSFYDHLAKQKRWCLKGLISRRATYFINRQQNYLVHMKSEKSLVQHCLAGGVINLLNDLPSPRGGVPVEILGTKTQISAFPFKLSLNYNIPIFFYLNRNIMNSGFKIEFHPAENFSSPEEGINIYIDMLHKQILGSPYMYDIQYHYAIQRDYRRTLDEVDDLASGMFA